MIRWTLTANHLYPIGGSRACLLRSILAPGMALDLRLKALGDSKGLAWVPEWPGDARMGWIALPSGGEHCFSGIQGSRARPKVRVDLEFLGPTINQTTA